MKSKHLALILAAASWTLGACNQQEKTADVRRQPSAETPKVETKTESTQVGSTLESKTETRTDVGHGDIKGKKELYIGTVTIYTVGKKIEVMTGEKKTHSFDLDDKNTSSTIDPGVTVGSRVRLVEETGDDKTRRITVRKEAAGS
jgi:hypothetical protein